MISLTHFRAQAETNTKTEEQAPTADKPLIIFAASSLQNLLDAASKRYSQPHRPQCGIAPSHHVSRHTPDIRISYGPSATLARQLTFGAPADIFISANSKWAQEVISSRKLSSPATLIAANTLVLAGSSHAPKLDWTAASLNAHLKDSKLVIADPATAPAGDYALIALEALSSMRPLLDQRFLLAPSAAHAALFVKKSAFPGILYGSAVAQDPDIKILAPIPASTYPAVHYQALRTSERTNASQDFICFLQSDEIAPLWRAAGFILP